MTELEKAVEAYIENPANYLEYQDGWEDLSDVEYVEKAFKAGANWQKQQMIDKACEWLKYYISYDDFGGNMEWLVPFENDECMIQHFKTYMEE